MTDKFSIRITKYYFNDWCLMNLLSTLLFLPYFQLNKLLPHNDKDVSKPGNFESHNSLKLSFANIPGFFLTLLNMNLFLNQTLLIFLFYV